MLSYCTNYLATMPDVAVYMNCDTRLAINLRMFDLGDDDEFIFTIKNYNHIESPYVFCHRARKSDIDENGEIVFKVPPEASKLLKPGAFYNFSVMINAFNAKKPTEYKKLTDNGRITLEYGAQDMLVKPEPGETAYEVISMRLEELVSEADGSEPSKDLSSKITGIRLEEVY